MSNATLFGRLDREPSWWPCPAATSVVLACRERPSRQADSQRQVGRLRDARRGAVRGRSGCGQRSPALPALAGIAVALRAIGDGRELRLAEAGMARFRDERLVQMCERMLRQERPKSGPMPIHLGAFRRRWAGVRSFTPFCPAGSPRKVALLPSPLFVRCAGSLSGAWSLRKQTPAPPGTEGDPDEQGRLQGRLTKDPELSDRSAPPSATYASRSTEPARRHRSSSTWSRSKTARSSAPRASARAPGSRFTVRCATPSGSQGRRPRPSRRSAPSTR